MKLRDFLKKYRLVVFLVVLIIILGFIKVYFKEKPINNNETFIKTITVTPTIIITSAINESEIEIIEDELDITKLSEETLKKYNEIKTEEEFNVFYDQLPENEKEIFSTEENSDEYCLEDYIPYESETFVIEKYIEENLLLVKTKGNNFIKSKNDLNEWLKQNECEPGKHMVVWEK